MGALEAYTAALIVKLFGHSPATIAMAPALYSAGLVAGQFAAWRAWKGPGVRAPRGPVHAGVLADDGDLERDPARGIRRGARLGARRDGRLSPRDPARPSPDRMAGPARLGGPVHLRLLPQPALAGRLPRPGDRLDLRPPRPGSSDRDDSPGRRWPDRPWAGLAWVGLAFGRGRDRRDRLPRRTRRPSGARASSSRSIGCRGGRGWSWAWWSCSRRSPSPPGGPAWRGGRSLSWRPIRRSPRGPCSGSRPFFLYVARAKLGLAPFERSLPVWVRPPWAIGPNVADGLAAVGPLFGGQVRGGNVPYLCLPLFRLPDVAWPGIGHGADGASRPRSDCCSSRCSRRPPGRDRADWHRFWALRGAIADVAYGAGPARAGGAASGSICSRRRASTARRSATSCRPGSSCRACSRRPCSPGRGPRGGAATCLLLGVWTARPGEPRRRDGPAQPRASARRPTRGVGGARDRRQRVRWSRSSPTSRGATSAGSNTDRAGHGSADATPTASPRARPITCVVDLDRLGDRRDRRARPERPRLRRRASRAGPGSWRRSSITKSGGSTCPSRNS